MSAATKQVTDSYFF